MTNHDITPVPAVRTRPRRALTVVAAAALLAAVPAVPAAATPAAAPSAVVAAPASAATGWAALRSGALSRTVPDGTRRPVEISQGTTTMYDVPGSQVQVVAGRAGEQRRVAFQVPTTVKAPGGAIDRAMLIWSVRCSPVDAKVGGLVPASGRAAESTRTPVPGTRAINGKNYTRNVLVGETHTAVVRTLVEFSAPGPYTCGATWGARSRYAVGGEYAAVNGKATLWVSAPVNDRVQAVQCYWPDRQFVGGHPEGCYYGTAPVPGSAAERIEPGGPALRINKVRATVAAPTASAPGAWMLAQASVAVTTCAGEQRSTSPCTKADLGGSSTLESTIQLRDANDRPYPTQCVEVDAKDDGHHRLHVTSAVHHEALHHALRFRIRPGCSPDVRVSTHVAVVAGKATWAQHEASQLTVSVETP